MKKKEETFEHIYELMSERLNKLGKITPNDAWDTCRFETLLGYTTITQAFTEIMNIMIEQGKAVKEGRGVYTIMKPDTKKIDYTKIKSQDQYLSPEYLKSKGFTLIEDESVFENMKMAYHAKDCVLLFFNSHRLLCESKDYFIGYGDMRNGKHHAVTFRWIDTKSELKNIYEAVTGKKL